MSLFAVVREAGPAWVDGEGAFGQPAVEDHSLFMGKLADAGVVLFAGPLAGSEQGRIGALVLMDAQDEDDVRQHLAADPWAVAGRLVVTSLESWLPLVGAERLTARG
jgi:uncharacterized protein